MLSMYVRTFGHGMSTVVETKGPTDMFATMWAVKMLKFLGLSDAILQCDPEPSLIKWAEKCQIQTHRKNCHSKFSQTVTSKQWRSRKLSETVAGTSADNAGSKARKHTLRTICRQRTDEMDCPTRSVAHSSFPGSEIQFPFYRAMGGPYRGKLVEFGETVLAHLPEVGKGSGNPAPKLADTWKSGVCLGKSDLTGEHLVRTDDGVVYARSVRRLAREQLVRREPQGSRRDPTEAEVDDKQMMHQIPEWYQKHMNKRVRTKERTRTMMRAEKHPTSQTTRIMKLRGRRFQSQTQQ